MPRKIHQPEFRHLYRGLTDCERAEWRRSASLTLRPREPLALSIDEATFVLVSGEDQRVVEHVLARKRNGVSLTTNRVAAAHFAMRETATTFRSCPGMIAVLDFPTCLFAAPGDSVDNLALYWNDDVLLVNPAELVTTALVAADDASRRAMADMQANANVDEEILLVIGELAVKRVEPVSRSDARGTSGSPCQRCIYEAQTDATYHRCE